MLNRFPRKLWIVVAGVVALILLAFAARRTAPGTPGFDPVAAAKTLFEELRGEGADLSRGPCLGRITDDWVADIAHDPRVPDDDNPENQCAEFRTGKATHFVELTPEGKLIRVK